ncbi:MAG: TonB-dependent receptor [Puniceicoccaceae bacterium]|nr:MAG: TonB-dependent receptor [Puniceicoccaceae bacterium]
MKLFRGLVFGLMLLPSLLPADFDDGSEKLVELDPLVVRSLPLARASQDLAQPTELVLGDRYADRRAGTLGATLDGLPGISATHYFPGAGRPIIRGFSNDRIRVLADGIDTFDASVGSLDHAVAAEPLAVERVEIIRGPATLLYGSNAVGGVVNVIDGRVPRRAAGPRVRGVAGAEFTGAARGGAGRVETTGGDGDRWAWQVSGAVRRQGDLSIPGFAATDPELQEQQRRGRLENSAVRSENLSLGISRLHERGFGGLAASWFATRYGLGRETEEEVVGVGPDGTLLIERELDDEVTIDLRQWRLDARAGWGFETGLVEEARLRLGFGDYHHDELEDGEVGTTFTNRAHELRLELVHRPAGRLSGAWGVQQASSAFEATGEEAFLRPSTMRKWAVFAFEELDFDDWIWQFGGRLEHQTIRPERFERDEIEGRETIPGSHRAGGMSAATGLVWRLTEQLRFNVAVNATQRLPNAQELYADGPHIGTFAYEISDHVATESFRREKALSLDLGLHGSTDWITWDVEVFAVRFSDYLQLLRTGELAFENQDGTFTLVQREAIDAAFLAAREAAGEEPEFLGVTRYTASDARYYGGEARATLHLLRGENGILDLTLHGDLVRTEDRSSGEPLARIPPARIGIEMDYQPGAFRFGAALRHAFEQQRVPAFEPPSRAHTVVDLRASWSRSYPQHRLRIGLRLENLFNEEARPATSFVRDLAPLAGRNLILTTELQF